MFKVIFKITLIGCLSAISIINSCFGQCFGENIDTSHIKTYVQDSTVFDGNLNGYFVDSCVYYLLDAVAMADNQKVIDKIYKPNEYFYAVTFLKSKSKNDATLNISPEKWNGSRSLDYQGFVKIRGMFFLLRGNLNYALFFHKSLINKLFFKLKLRKQEKDELLFNSEPILTGVFYECEALPMYVEVYVKKTIPGFGMDIKEGHSSIYRGFLDN